MKHQFKKLFDPLMRAAVRNKLMWKAASMLARAGDWIKYQRSIYERGEADSSLQVYFREKIVMSGYFKGMMYPSFSAAGSSLYPKLSGSYESELHPLLLKWQKNDYTTIIDIGCAEGYYAVGMALRYPNAKIYGYDIDANALRLCEALALHNKVANRVLLNETCTATTLRDFEYTGRCLIICDCEGYENELFTSENLISMAGCDMIIELHPFISVGIKECLNTLFEDTHVLSIISSHDNNRKIFDNNQFLSVLSGREQLHAVEEGRPFTMDWLIAASKSYTV